MNSVDSKALKEKIKIAKEAVSEETDETYKTEAFKVILSKLIDSDISNISSETKHRSDKKPKLVVNEDTLTKTDFAKKCGLETKELDDVMAIDQDIIQIIAPLEGKETEKQKIATPCILAAYEGLFGQEWVSSTQLRKCLDMSGVGELDHFARNIKRQGNMVRTKGKKPNLEYRLVGPGRLEAFKIIKRLAKGEGAE